LKNKEEKWVFLLDCFNIVSVRFLCLNPYSIAFHIVF
jgi:hypothetical protein